MSGHDKLAEILAPFKAHHYYTPAMRTLRRVAEAKGMDAAVELAQKMAVEFEEVILRDAASGTRLVMEAAPYRN